MRRSDDSSTSTGEIVSACAVLHRPSIADALTTLARTTPNLTTAWDRISASVRNGDHEGQGSGIGPGRLRREVREESPGVQDHRVRGTILRQAKRSGGPDGDRQIIGEGSRRPTE